MRKQILMIISLTIFLIACDNDNYEASNFSKTGEFYTEIEQRSVLIGQIVNIKDFVNAPHEIKLAVNDITIDSQHLFETKIDDDGKFLFDIPLYHSINSFLRYGDSRITPYLFPNDTLYLKCKIEEKNGRLGIVSGEFDKKHDRFQNDFMIQFQWTHDNLSNFRRKLSSDLSPQDLKQKYLDFEKVLFDKIKNRVKEDSLSDFLSDYMRYSAQYSIYEDIIKQGNKIIKDQDEKLEFYSFLTDSIIFNKKAMITYDYNAFLNKYQFYVESIPGVILENKERTKEEFRLDITTKELEKNLKLRTGVWAEYLASSRMYFTAFLEEEINLSVIDAYSEMIEENFKEPYIKQLLLTKCDETREKLAMIKDQNIPKNAKVNKYASVKGEELWKKILDDNKNRIIYVDVWATWCSPCKRQMPHSLAMQEMFTDVAFVYLCIQSKEDTWKNVIRQYQITGTHILLNDEQYNYLKEKFSIEGVPHYVLIDKNGSMIFNDYPGCKTEQVIENKLKNLIAEKISY